MHDNQWLLGWAAEDVDLGGGHFARPTCAGSRTSSAAATTRSERLVRDLELAAEVVGDDTEGRRELVARLRQGADTLRGGQSSQATFT